MREIAPEERTSELVEQLLDVWEGSVRTTHLFLSDAEVLSIRECVPEAITGVPLLIIEENANGAPVAFMGIDGDKLEMLFVAQEERGNGIGKKLLQHGMDAHGVTKLDVNEQNPRAAASTSTWVSPCAAGRKSTTRAIPTPSCTWSLLTQLWHNEKK